MWVVKRYSNGRIRFWNRRQKLATVSYLVCHSNPEKPAPWNRHQFRSSPDVPPHEVIRIINNYLLEQGGVLFCHHFCFSQEIHHSPVQCLFNELNFFLRSLDRPTDDPARRIC